MPPCQMKMAALFVVSALMPCCELARILGVFEFNSKSHFQMFEPLMKALAAKGHQVTVLGHFPQKRQVPNYTDIDVSGSLPDLVDNVTVDLTAEYGGLNIVWMLWGNTRTFCEEVLEHDNAQALLRSDEKFDLVIAEIVGAECSAGFSFKFKAPLVGIVTCVPYPWTHGRIGNPDHPAYTPSYFVPYTSRMDFPQRLHNTLYNLALVVGNHFFNDVPTGAMLKKYFGEGIPSVKEVVAETSLILVNSHFSITEPRPTLPAYVEVGGLHVQQPKPLPDGIQKFLDESEHGVVYFSLGSLLRAQSLPPEKMQALLDAFAALPERVLMKYTGDTLPGKPVNVMIGKWLPQLDILCHPNIKVFISHGGLMGSQESVYAGVPIIGIPFFADQDLNIVRLANLGMALNLGYDQLTKDNILKAIRTVIEDKRYSESAKRVSARFRDRPMSALDTAVYWVEYVIRHRGAPHLRSAAADMPLYQYLLLDVIAFLLIVASTCAYILYYTGSRVLRSLTNTKSRTLRKRAKRD